VAADAARPAGMPAQDAETRAGLSAQEAARRLARYGPNELETARRFWAVRPLLMFFANPLVLILLVASVISGLLGEPVNALLITVIVLLSAVLDFLQVARSEQAARRLKQLVAPAARVWRDGRLVEVPVREVVPGDLLDVRAGDLIPADAILIPPGTLAVDEAALTGESLPIEKWGGAAGDAGRIWAGTSVVSGVALASVTATGTHTQFGAIARALLERAPPTDFEVGMRRFSLLITRTVIGLVLFVLLVEALLRRDPLQSFLFALALAVGLTPEFLPMIITVTLAQGAQRMARDHVIVKRLAAIEHLGSMDVLCTDKTGTLTQGRISLQQHVDVRGAESEAVLRWACVNSALESGVRTPLDDAILAHEHPAIPAYVKLAELPFDFQRRRVSVLASGPDGVQVIVKGAPEELLPRCARVEDSGAAVPFAGHLQHLARQTFERLSREGYHVLAIAHKPVPNKQCALTPDDESDLTLSGFAAFLDPPAPLARETLAWLRAHGVQVKILTGDGELVTRTICDQVGLPAERVILGDELSMMSDDALAAVVEQASVFARVTPIQKNRIIRALKRNGHVVGYVGDGINDAPSLHAADTGISVANGVDVAKAAADIILLERSLAAICRGVEEGRRSFANVTKYVLMGTSSNFGNMLSMAAASAVLPFLPLLPVQILLNNFLYDAAQLTIPTDHVDEAMVVAPRRWDASLIERFMFVLGPVSSLYDALTFLLLLLVFHAGPATFRAGWFLESLATQTLVIFVIRTAGHPWQSHPSPALAVSALAAIGAGFAIAFSPLGETIEFEAPSPLFLIVLLVLTITYLAIVEGLKRRLDVWHTRGAPGAQRDSITRAPARA